MKLKLQTMADVAEDVGDEIEHETVWPQTRVVVFQRQSVDGETYFEWVTLSELNEPDLVAVYSFEAEHLTQMFKAVANMRASEATMGRFTTGLLRTPDMAEPRP